MRIKGNLELAKECDNFPYYEDDPDDYNNLVSSCYEFRLHETSRKYGYIPHWVVEKMAWDSDWMINHEKRQVSLASPNTMIDQQNEIIAKVLDNARRNKVFEVLDGWRNELYSISRSRLGDVSIERAGSALFGVVTYGVHMTAYIKTQTGIKIWVPRRASNKQTYAGMLDNTVAGGISTGETALESLVREAAEEASFPEELICSNAKACGAVTYFYIRDERAGGETGLFQPEVQYVYDLEVDPSIIPKPSDDEVEKFYLWTTEEVKQALAEGQFKPNCAVVLLDFFVRHGILTTENEQNLVEIISRIHRKLPFDTCQRSELIDMRQ